MTDRKDNGIAVINADPERINKYRGARRRKPRRNGFLYGMIIYAVAALMIIGAAIAIGWRYVSLRDETLADTFVSGIALNTDAEGWKQLLRQQLPLSYPSYEDGRKLAYEVLSDKFSVGRVTYIRYAGRSGVPVYELFSDGRAFATLTLSDEAKGVFGLGEWTIGSMLFHIDYFDGVDFPTYSVTLPEGAILSVNGITDVIGNTVNSGVEYPAITPAEVGRGLAPSTEHIFHDIYHEPVFEATLNGVELELHRTLDGRVYFAYPESATHTCTVTVPEGVTAKLGGAVIDESWATRVKKEGQLGELDDGGSGTLPMLDVWTVKGLFGQPEVSAEVYGNSVKLLSSEGGNYVFDTPPECKYNITVIVPSGSEVTVNGHVLDAAGKVEGGATMDDLDSGTTAIGNYSVAELTAVPSALPSFDKYIVSGYLALPSITASLNGTPLVCSGVTTDVYDVVWEFDYTLTGAFDEARISDAKHFAETYIKYICDGGAWDNPENAPVLDANYEAMKSRLVPGTSAYVSMMESFRMVYKLPHYTSYTVDSLETGEYVVYAESCVSCRVTYSVTRTLGADGTPETLTGRIMVLQVNYNGEWRIWGYVYE